MFRQAHKSLSLCAVLALSAAAGCEKKPEATADSGAPATATTAAADAGATATATATGGDDAGAAGDAGAKLAMDNCPTAVPGATVAIKDVEGGVEVTITAKDDATTSTIRDRTKKLATAADRPTPDGGAAKHDHSGSGGGTTGRCTIVVRGTTLTTSDVPSGSKVVVKAKDKAEVDWVRRETRDRDKEAKAAVVDGAGVQRMAHCPSAVEGAKTTVKDSKEGVVVTITAAAEKTGELRTRAKYLADISKKPDADKVEHTGAGTGGGGLGRCPIVVDGATTVDVKDVEGGVEATVKAKKDVAALQKESKARAANFTAPK